MSAFEDALENTNYYLEQKKVLMEQVSSFSESLKAAMTPVYGADEADAVAKRMVGLYEGMIEDLPYIGGASNRYTGILIQCSQSMAFCLAMREQGHSFDEAGQFNYMTIAKYYENNPPPADQRSVEQKRSDWAQLAKWTQEHAKEYPGGWIAEYVEEVPVPFTHGIDFIQCGNLELCRKLGIPEFAPYICMLDKIIWKARGQGLIRTAVLACDSDRCIFRFREGGIVKLEEPFAVERFREWGISDYSLL
jgi:hypothetical protein